jgi:transposase
MGRRSYTVEFKAEAVRLVEERGVSMRQAARELGMSVNTLQAWIVASRTRGGARAPSGGATQQEVARLQREVVRLRMERDILKKAAAYFARESK